jgi:hypothetical protein
MNIEIKEHYKITDLEFDGDIRKIEVFIDNEKFDEFREGYGFGRDKYMAYPFVEGLLYGRDNVEVVITKLNDEEY